MAELPTKDALMKLPLRGVVAYAVRFARRVQLPRVLATQGLSALDPVRQDRWRRRGNARLQNGALAVNAGGIVAHLQKSIIVDGGIKHGTIASG